MSIQTIKLSYTCDFEYQDLIFDVQKTQNNLINLAYNRTKDGLNEKQIRDIFKSYNHINSLCDSWLTQCAIKKGIALHSSHLTKNNDKHPIFGGKKLWNLLVNNKITKEQWKKDKLFPINIQGEAPQKGNRKFNLDISNNKIVFKLNKNTHIDLQINPSLNQKKLLKQLENRVNLKECPYSIQLNSTHIWISFEQPVIESKKNNNVHAGIDLNPNYLGLVITKKDKVIHEVIFNLTELNKCKNTDKFKHEKIEICKSIHKILVHYQVCTLFLEQLNIKNKDHNKGKTFNKLVNNQWHRKIIIEQLTKRCDISNITISYINAAYSSFIGNILFERPDAISAATEITRRGIALKRAKMQLTA